uniref:Putative spore wall protein 4 n=1 Tax=Nosema pernyi TaxID=1112939 RepID=A0A0N7ADS5_9MICR|nr:putative spore wall protein 4 [Nosema pernyi]
MNFKLVPILLCAIFCTKRNLFPEIDMTKLYNITTSVPSTIPGAPPIVRNITEKIPGLFVCFDNDEESIIIKVNTTPDNILAQDLTITITPQDNVKPNLLTIKTYDDLRNTIQFNNDNDNGRIIINLTRNSPEGEFLLTYNGEVDVKLTSDESTIATAQTYNFASPLFLEQLITPVITETERAGFRLNNVVAVNKLLSEFDQTFRLIRRLFEKRDLPEESIRNLCRLYHAEKVRYRLAKCCKTEKVYPCNIVGECDKFEIQHKFEPKEICKPTVCFEENEYSLCVINAVAVKVLFETFKFGDDCSKDAFTKYAQTICAIKSCVDIRESAVILYHAVNAFCATGSKQKDAYQSCLKNLNVDISVMSRYYYVNSNISSAICSTFAEDELKAVLKECDEAEEMQEEEEEETDSKTSSSKDKSSGMSNKKKLMIAGGLVVVVVVVAVSAVVFFT